MKENILDYLACPNRIGSKTCHNKLTVAEVFSYFKSRPAEIREGYLKCKACSRRFPIFFGIPVLINNLPEYLRDNLYIILELSKRYGGIDKGLIVDSLSLAEQARPKDKKELFSHNRGQYLRRIKAIFENNYIINHFDNFLSLAKPGEPLYDFLRKYRNKTPHLILEEFLNSHSNSKVQLALEIGCNVGGFLLNLSQKARFIFGLDNSFEHLFFASCLLKHLPIKIKQYNIIIEAGIKKRRCLNIEVIANLTLIAAEGDNLPFRDSSLSIVSSCNLIDVIDNPRGLLQEKMRVLKKSGLILSSDPYQFLNENKKKLGIKRGQTPWQRIQQILEPEIKILAERDYIPWITYGYRRNYTVYYNHCFCGMKVN